MEKKFSLPIPVGYALAAIVALIVALFLILTNPSRLPITTSVNKPDKTVKPTETVFFQSPSEEGKDNAIIVAKKSLSRQLNVGIDKISVVKASMVTWPDTALGCPQPGLLYAQILTPGYRIQLKANGKSYDYHAGTSENVILCDNP